MKKQRSDLKTKWPSFLTVEIRFLRVFQMFITQRAHYSPCLKDTVLMKFLLNEKILKVES